MVLAYPTCKQDITWFTLQLAPALTYSQKWTQTFTVQCTLKGDKYSSLSDAVFIIYNTVEPLLKDTPNKGHNTFDLSIKDKFCGPYRIMAIQFYPEGQPLYNRKIMPKITGPKVSVI